MLEAGCGVPQLGWQACDQSLELGPQGCDESLEHGRQGCRQSLELAIRQSGSGFSLVLEAGCGVLQLGWQDCDQSLELGPQGCDQSLELCLPSVELAVCQSSSGIALVLAAGCGVLQMGWQACDQSLELGQ